MDLNAPIAVKIRGIGNHFGDQVIHDGVDLDVRNGEILGVVGGSGTGKSVLMRTIIGLQRPSAGEIEIFGEPMTDEENEAQLDLRRRWGVMFQGGALFSTLTVAENVQVPLREFYPNLGQKLLDEIAAYKVVMAGLPANAAAKYPSELSGGMRKRAGLARALALDPRLLFLDEPTAGMSPEETRQTGEMLRALNAQGVTILAVEHDMSFVQQIADRVTVLHFGEIFAQGTVSAIISHPGVAEIYLGASDE